MINRIWKLFQPTGFPWLKLIKERGKERKDNLIVNLEEFIAVKGITALGNQLTKEKVNQISLLEPLPYEAPEEVHADDLEVVDEEDVSLSSEESTEGDNQNRDDSNSESDDDRLDDKGQTKLF